MSDQPRVLQPYLHRLTSCVSAPSVVLSGPGGQIREGAGTQGWLRDDVRLLSRLEVALDGTEPEPVGSAPAGAGGASFTAVARLLGDTGADPTVRVERERTALPDGMDERIRLANDARAPVETTVSVRIGADLATTSVVKHGGRPAPAPVSADGAVLSWGADGTRVEARADPEPDDVRVDAEGAVLTWRVAVDAHAAWDAVLRLRASGDEPAFRAPGTGAARFTARVRSADGDLDRLVARSLADLDALRLADPRDPADVFLAAGSPWFFTLFGRDSLWAARMLLPLGTATAAGTLRVLARRQGTGTDRVTAEQPGRILHEVRGRAAMSDGHALPPLYFGTIDATPLWVLLLHEAWQWGMPEAEVRALLPNLRAALDWITGPADDDGDGFLDYIDTDGTGLANQGWKDSGDSIQWPDGRIAEPPIGLSEAQGYAHQAALAGADLLDHFHPHPAGGAPADDDRARDLRTWAAALRHRFRGAFWVSDAEGPFPALALDGDKRPVATATSNLGHLLGTGLLDDRETELVARRLAGRDLDSGYGLRTMTATAAGFNPLGYHAGAIWPHDTAVAVLGLSGAGAGDTAASLADGLLAAAPAFDYRLPELFGGTDARAGEPVLAYPASCRPQAWAAAAVIPLLTAALRLSADVPAGVLRVDPDPAFAHWFPLSIRDLRIGGHPLHIEVDAAGTATVETTAPVRVEGAAIRAGATGRPA
ncbi:glycogen debranching N-terminal domain-containing protein [Nocardiopsis mangrovi]|uniref:Glycogen debranching N-terminal domain-containing protein n=1 Tax=Nocardiopsis mangrovi TaxID=1179818 RepID=A0ABV9DYH6_9ACTN